jgi:hypothetical protein
MRKLADHCLTTKCLENVDLSGRAYTAPDR